MYSTCDFWLLTGRSRMLNLIKILKFSELIFEGEYHEETIARSLS